MKHLTLLSVSSTLLLSACTLTSRTPGGAVSALTFDGAKYTAGTTTVNGQEIKYRAYENIVYVQNPEDAQYQSMNIYIPEAYFTGGTVGGYTAQTAPIFLPNQVGGYLPALPGTVSGGGLGGMGLAAGGQAPTTGATAATGPTPTTPATGAATSAPAGQVQGQPRQQVVLPG